MQRLITCACIVAVLSLSASCRDVTLPMTQPPEPEAPPPERPTAAMLGLVEVTISGIGSEDMQATATEYVPNPDPVTEGADAAPADLVAMPGSGIQVEPIGTGSFTEGTRAQGGQRYIYATFRVRNAQGSAPNTAYGTPRTNLTLIAVGTATTIPGTAISRLNRFDGEAADPLVASSVVPTGATYLDHQQRMSSPFPDVLQVFTEAEVLPDSLPASGAVTNRLPYGFIVRNPNDPNSRTLPANPLPQQFNGQVTFAFRLPLQPTSAQDPFSISFVFVAVDDTQTRMTESIEEAQDSAAVRRLRERATALGATTVTVLNGSGRADPGVPNYPGQRQICSPRTAGTSAQPAKQINAPGAYSDFMLLKPGETPDACAPYFRTGTPGRPATNVAFPLAVRAVDRYGNTLNVADTVSIEMSAGSPPFTSSPPTALSSGVATLSMTFSDYGTGIGVVRGRRLRGTDNPIQVAGVTRVWTAGAETTNWHTGGNWDGGAVPMSQDSVLIPTSPSGGAFFPELASNASIMGVLLQDGATLALGPFDLTAGANVATGLTGGINSSVGRLFLTGVARTVRGNLPRLRVSGTYTLDGNVTARAPLRVESGRLRAGGFRIRAASQ